MFRSIYIRNNNVSVQFQEHKIAIINNEQLATLLKKAAESATDELVSAIKKEFHIQFNKDLDVSDASMAVEIWGHVFTEKFANAINELVPGKLTDSFAEKINSHCEVINIGEKDYDHNRFIWDWLSVLKSAIAAVLPGTN